MEKGDLIAIVAPASAVKREYVEGTANYLELMGYRVLVYPSAVSDPVDGFAASEEMRRRDFMAALEEEEVSAILCARGGYGCVQLLDGLAPEIIERNAKWLIGFSDVSALHAAFNTAGVPTMHAPMAKHLARLPEPNPVTAAWLATLATATQQPVEYPTSDLSQYGDAVGVLIGGNMAVLSGLADTPFDPMHIAAREDTILFIEDIAEPVYKVQRMLYRLHLGGWLKRVKALAVGQFTDYKPGLGYERMEGMIKDFLMQHGYGKLPVAFGFPAGHDQPNYPLLLGARAMLSINGESTRLTSAE